MVTANSFGTQDSKSVEALENSGVELIYRNRPEPWSENELLDRVSGIDGLIIGADQVTEKVIQSADSLKIIAKHGVGLDNIDIEAATRSGICVTAGIRSNTIAVAEMTISLMFAIARNLVISDAEVKENKWNKRIGIELTNKIAGIVGLGSIGREVAIRLKGLKMNLIAVEPYRDNIFAEENNIKFVNIETLASEADIITLHSTLLPETKHIINNKIFSMMKKNAILINTARGELVDEVSLYDALSEKKIYGAAFDTFTEEPPIDSKLLGLSNFIGTPHIGAYTNEAVSNMSCLAAFSIRDFIDNKIPCNLINKEVIKKLKGWKKDV